ncbi:MAG: hypothetical protein JJV88_03525 [Sulfurovum sp.]|nr:hypothetical protein [Sulfurovaceae bacterium]
MNKLEKYLEYKESGVEWIGEIPEHWNTVKSKRLFTARKEKARKSDMQLTAFQKHGVIYRKDYMKLESRKVTRVETNYEILKRVEPNDFLISMRSFQGGIEYCRIAKYLDNETTKINKAINPQQQQITKLKEYKTTLIDSVVTGKARVA